MKILFNCLTLEKGGAERVITTLANKFVRENEVTIVTLKNSNVMYDISNDVKHISVDKKNYHENSKLKNKLLKISIIRLLKLKKIILLEKPDIIISFLPEPSLKLMLIKKIFKNIKNIPVVISIRNDPNIEYKSKLLKFITTSLYNNVDGMVYQTQDAKKFFENSIKSNNIAIIPNPINEKFFVNVKPDEEKTNTIISVGRLESQKNHILLIHSFAKANMENDSYILKIFGSGSMNKIIQDEINILGLDDKVFLKGQNDVIEEELNNSKIFVLSSNYEGMPNSLMEALAMGLPCISTDCPCGGPKELIDNKNNGILVPVNNERELTKELLNLMNDSSLRKKIGTNALNIRDKYNIEVIYEKWDKLIKKIVRK